MRDIVTERKPGARSVNEIESDLVELILDAYEEDPCLRYEWETKKNLRMDTRHDVRSMIIELLEGHGLDCSRI